MRRFALPMALLIAFALVAPVAAESKSATYKGAITDGSRYCVDGSTVTGDSTVTEVDPPPVTGESWTLNLSNDRTATVTFHVSYDGIRHAWYGVSGGAPAVVWNGEVNSDGQASLVEGWAFQRYPAPLVTFDGDVFTVVLDLTGFGFTCNSDGYTHVAYRGVVSP